MNITDELLMAYADGEVDETTGQHIERAIAADASLRAKVEQHRALRTQLSAAFDPVLSEPVPDRLKNLAAGTGPTNVTDLSQARTAREARQTRFFQQPTAWMSLAASVVLGVAIGFFGLGERDSGMIVAQAEGLAASGDLANALAKNLSADSNSAGVHIGISFLAKTGEYCRSFAVTDGAFAGYACRDTDAWRIRMLTPARVSETGDFRTASSVLPESVLAAIDDDMDGAALDADEEAKARDRGWRR